MPKMIAKLNRLSTTIQRKIENFHPQINIFFKRGIDNSHISLQKESLNVQQPFI